MDDTYAGISLCQLTNEIRCPIRRVVVHKNCLPPRLVKSDLKALEQWPNVIPFVECWNYDRQLRHLRKPLLRISGFRLFDSGRFYIPHSNEIWNWHHRLSKLIV